MVTKKVGHKFFPPPLFFLLDPGIRDPGWKKTGIRFKTSRIRNTASMQGQWTFYTELSLYKWPLQKSLDAISATGRQKLEMNISK